MPSAVSGNGGNAWLRPLQPRPVWGTLRVLSRVCLFIVSPFRFLLQRPVSRSGSLRQPRVRGALEEARHQDVLLLVRDLCFGTGRLLTEVILELSKGQPLGRLGCRFFSMGRGRDRT